MKFFSTVSKTALTMMVGASLLGGCDPSKEELDKAREQLSKTASERDQLKGQVSTMQTSMDTMTKDFNDAKAKLADAEKKVTECAAAAAAPLPVVDPKAAAKTKTVPKTNSKVAPPAAKVDTTAPVGTQANPIKTSSGPAGGL